MSLTKTGILEEEFLAAQASCENSASLIGRGLAWIRKSQDVKDSTEFFENYAIKGHTTLVCSVSFFCIDFISNKSIQ